MTEVSALGPVDPASVPAAEEEKAAPWIVRKLVGVSAKITRMCGRAILNACIRLEHDRTHRDVVLGDPQSLRHECGLSLAGV